MFLISRKLNVHIEEHDIQYKLEKRYGKFWRPDGGKHKYFFFLWYDALYSRRNLKSCRDIKCYLTQEKTYYKTKLSPYMMITPWKRKQEFEKDPFSKALYTRKRLFTFTFLALSPTICNLCCLFSWNISVKFCLSENAGEDKNRVLCTESNSHTGAVHLAV